MQEEKKLCADALLLLASLSDQLQLLDMEKNVKNYQGVTRVFKCSEKNFFTLAGYHDRMMLGGGDGGGTGSKNYS